MRRTIGAVIAFSCLSCTRAAPPAEPIAPAPTEDEAREPEPGHDIAGNVARCERGEPDACYATGVAYSEGTYAGQAVDKDLAVAAAAYAKACVGQHAEACHMSGHAMVDGWAGPVDAEAGVARLTLACGLKSADACFDVAQTQWDNGDYAEGIAGLQNACALASDKGCYELGLLYVRDAVPDKSGAMTALDLLDKACARGYAPSCAAVGELYERGEPMANLEAELSRAMDSYERACQLDATYGCLELGRVYQFGAEGVAVDLERAVELYTSSCDGENAFGCAHLADLLLAKEAPEASATEDRACALSAEVCVDLGDAYAKADHRKKDSKRAASFYEKACESKSAEGCEKVAALTRESKAAKAWYAKACALRPAGAPVCKKAK